MLCQLKALANPAYFRFNGFLRPNGSPFKGILNKANCLDLFSSVLSQHVCIFIERQKKKELSLSKPPARNILWLLFFSLQKYYSLSFLHESRFDRLQWKKEEIIQSCNIILKMCIKQCPFIANSKSSMQFHISLFIPKFK